MTPSALSRPRGQPAGPPLTGNGEGQPLRAAQRHPFSTWAVRLCAHHCAPHGLTAHIEAL